MKEYSLKVTPDLSGMRLDLFIIKALEDDKLGLSRTSVQKLIEEGKVSSKTILPLKAHHKVKADDEVNIIIEDKKEQVLSAEDIVLDIVYEDDDLAIINKQAGLVVHPAPGNYEHTLVNALLYHFKNLSDVNPKRPGIVHRLDKETSGLLVVAKNNFSHQGLVAQFAEHSIKRKYVAVVRGKMEFDENKIELPIGRHPIRRMDMSVSFSENNKYALTYYKTLKRSHEYSLLELEPFTGRTHQLRVHLAYLGHPVLGDEKYGRNNKFKRMCLHAKELGFIHPRKERLVQFSCAVPKEFLELFVKNA